MAPSIRERIRQNSLQGCYFYTYHSHQPYLVEDGRIVSNLRKMWCAGNDKDRYEARQFYRCYLNPAQKVMEAHEQGKPYAACMVDYSGTLLEGLLDMDREGLFAAEGMPSFVETFREAFARHPEHLELLLIPWSHPYLDGGTPLRDIDRQIGRAFELYEAVFGRETRERVKGFFPPELGLPKDPDVLYELVRRCRERGLRWMLVNESSLEDRDGQPVPSGYAYTREVKNRAGAEASIGVLPRQHDIYQSEGGGHAAAKSALHSRLGESETPLMLGSAGDLENGGVMMNEHWGPWLDTVGDQPGDPVAPATGSAYLEGMLEAAFGSADWARADELFRPVRSHGGSWTYDSAHWTEGENKQALDSLAGTLSEFHNDLLEAAGGEHPENGAVAEAWYASERGLFILETSCYRYWGDSGDWMEAGFALVQQAVEQVNAFAGALGESRRARLSDGAVEIG